MDMHTFLEQYNIHPNEDQSSAIAHTTGPALVLAGPGSGKTTVITARCAYLAHQMETGALPACGILTVAFNRAAAAEMAQRYEKVFQGKKPAGQEVDFATFHSFCNRLIARYEQMNGISLQRLDESQRELLITDIYESKHHVTLSPAERKKLAGELSRMKNALKAQSALSASNFKNLPEIYETYNRFKKSKGCIDFDDMLFEAKHILETYPRILQEVQQSYGFFQVDEGQDLSAVQMEILMMLGKNVFLVGDDDQGIYGFRGARPESIVHMEGYFPGCVTYALKQNYRSTERIVAQSSNLIRKNEVRLDKTFFTEKGKGRKPKCKVFLDDRDWLDFVYAKISRKNAGSCGILYRNGASSVLPMMLCYKHNIPFTVSGGQSNFFDSFVTQDMLHMFSFEAQRKYIFHRKPAKVLREYLRSGYLKELRARCEKMSLRYEDMLRYVSAWEYLVSGLQKCSEVQSCFAGFQEAVQTAGANKGKLTDAGLHLSTVHSAKGLEYDTVFIIDLYEGEFPKRCGEEQLADGQCEQSQTGLRSESVIAEERRLFYVAMTRAKKQLYMLYPAKRFDLTLNPGLFWQEVRKGSVSHIL